MLIAVCDCAVCCVLCAVCGIRINAVCGSVRQIERTAVTSSAAVCGSVRGSVRLSGSSVFNFKIK
jgi:hypothetical protein